tara:strand:- start:317 stop:502 length:186 start_codon:yes stop_codon:yes gene_type:complete
MSDITLSDKQRQAIEKLKERHHTVHDPTPLGGSDKCVMVKVEASNGSTMWIGIEEDGYAHS